MQVHKRQGLNSPTLDAYDCTYYIERTTTTHTILWPQFDPDWMVCLHKELSSDVAVRNNLCSLEKTKRLADLPIE